jgi:hypothetical protein
MSLVRFAKTVAGRALLSVPACGSRLAGVVFLVFAAVEMVGVSGAAVWIDLAEDESYTARHECSFVQAGDQFYLFGGRESPQVLDTYDYASDSWSASASAPIPFNHFQATEYQGLIWVIGAFKTNNFPNELPSDSVYVFDPAADVWMQGPTIPVARRRGSTGLVVYDSKFYVVGGNTIGHNGGYVSWFDEFDPQTGEWAPLVDAPRARDHFHAVVAADELFVIGGRLSGGPGGTFAPLIPEVDVYDFATDRWTTLPRASDLPTPRAAASVARFDGKVLVIGGEGNGQAYATVEALDPVTSTWSTLASLNHARHGTQAIESGLGVYVVSGSPTQGGGNQRNMEVYNADVPSGSASTLGILSTPLNVPFFAAQETVPLAQVAGNEGIFIESITLSGPDAVEFDLVTPVSDPFVIPVAGSRDVVVEFVGIPDGALASLDISYSGGQTRSVMLLPEPGAASSLFAGALLLAGLKRRKRRTGNLAASELTANRK